MSRVSQKQKYLNTLTCILQHFINPRSLIWSRHWSGPPTFHGKTWDCSPCHLTRICWAMQPVQFVLLSEFMAHRFIFFVQISFFWLRTSALTKRNENMIDHAPSTFVEAQRHNKYCLHYMISKQHVYMQTNKYNNVSASCSLHTKGMKHPGKAHGAVVFSTWIMFLPVVVASHECVR